MGFQNITLNESKKKKEKQNKTLLVELRMILQKYGIFGTEKFDLKEVE
jgi:hypothetical protein